MKQQYIVHWSDVNITPGEAIGVIMEDIEAGNQYAVIDPDSLRTEFTEFNAPIIL